ncbi:hypothetical protein [Actinokineospora sp. NBRC 105648]|uniref:hypothetical protein n=1 Tax=Actinokineospora sp. NBRC 105648 TaxID=3032206 RepID=UPI0024A17259|nr:hypothetical protein [Actinokineospora sp. NBRC 105648]GLZ42292.1 hypothetical protein Acsp05_59160 [Actinokineospora sp. NBRC 105648]
MTLHRATAAVRRTLPLPGEYPCGLAWDGTHLWHSDQLLGKVYALDPGDGRVVRTLDCPAVRADLTFDGRWLCQVGMRPKRLLLIDRETGERVGRREVPPASGRLTGVEACPDGMWMCLRGPTVLQLRETREMTILREHPVAGGQPSGLTWADGVVVHGDYVDRRLRATDPDTGAELGSVPVSGNPTGVTWDGEHLWYCDFPGRRIHALRLDDVLGHS